MFSETALSRHKKKYRSVAEYVMKLVKCESIFVEEQATGVCLPARINVK